MLEHAINRVQTIQDNRYLFSRSSHRSSKLADAVYKEDLQEGEGAWLNDFEFLHKYRMSCANFWSLLDVIKDDPVFQQHDPNGRGRPQRPVSYQLLTALKFFGTEGSGNSNPSLRNVFKTGRGTNICYIRRVSRALTNRRDEFIAWPDSMERKTIASRIRDLSGMPNCVGIIDGTLFPLAFSPQTIDAPNYKGRKHGYTLSSVIVCDDKRVIRYYNCGWPGSTHDNRIFRNTSLANNPHSHFDKNQYLIGDSAFVNRWFMVSAFTSPPGVPMDWNEMQFNKALSKARVISEHTIGILKGRFAWLRSIRKVIKEDPKTLHEILCFIDATVVLHNFLMMQEGNDDLDDEWDEVVSLADAFDRLPDDDELNQEAYNTDNLRRNQLMAYLLEVPADV